MPSTRSLQMVLDIVQTSKGMKPLTNVGGIVNQPGLEICNNTLQLLLSAPYNWRFNKYSILPFTTIAYQQDYILSGCNVFCKGRYAVHVNATTSPAGAGLIPSGGTVTVNYSDFAPNGIVSGSSPTVGDSITIGGAFQPTLNNPGTVTAILSPTSFQCVIPASFATSPDGGQGFSSPGINWMEHVSMSDFQSSGNITPVHDGEIVASLFMESICQPPFKWAFQSEVVLGGTTCILIRSWPVSSSQIWGIYLFYQAKAPLKTDLSQFWDPFPDDLAYAVTSNVRAVALDWWEDPRAVNAMLLGQQNILKALGSKDQEARSESMFPDLPILRGG